MATIEALRNAKMDQDYIDSKEVGILYGNDSSADPVVQGTDIIRAKKDTMMVGSGSVFKTMNSTVTMNLATIFKLTGCKFYDQCCLRQWVACNRTWIPFYKNGVTGYGDLWRCAGNKCKRNG